MSPRDAVPVTWAGSRLHRFVRRWWQGELGMAGQALRVLLLPAEGAFRAIVALRNAGYRSGIVHATRATVPVLSVGNLRVGGSGKTPFSAWLVRTLVSRGARPALLHGGYAADEPALHRHWHADVHVIARRDRVAAAADAVAGGANVLVLDDGFQHRRLARDLDIVLIAAEDWTARPRLLPNGPWRETPASLERADLLVVTRRSAGAERAAAVAHEVAVVARGKPVVIAAILPLRWTRDGREVEPPAGSALAVTAIAMPELFAASVHDAGGRIDRILAFPDHHLFVPADIERVRSESRGRTIVTTAKDAMKLSALAAEADVRVLEQVVHIEAGASALEHALDRIVQ